MIATATHNQAAFLDMLAFSELGRDLLMHPHTDRGYKVIVGSTAKAPILMANYKDHPRRLIFIREGLSSTAAGRYQLLGRYFDHYKRVCKLSDFGPDAQDAIALQQIKEQGALGDIESGHLQMAVAKCANIWASLPGAGYGQHEHSMRTLEAAYEHAGGNFA